MRYAIRETEIHKDLDHNRIVRHFNTIEIDQNTFCTILELCSGPDLSLYLNE